MPFSPPSLGHNNDDNVLPTTYGIKPAREHPRIAGPRTAADHVRIGERLSDLVAICRQQIRMLVGDVALPLLVKLNVTAKIRAGEESCHRD